ncbi:hypothetical protein A4X09_0g5671 [Tilletia walkeri]|uniref:EF-hand domain-containing protein n=1 Tax=Tilletia walkeri TaxID=117179 RepID=A0A8X7N6R9_9BASI|nr:hypothetical protein A4X09_0g5671 [Tilletia walkeri]
MSTPNDHQERQQHSSSSPSPSYNSKSSSSPTDQLPQSTLTPSQHPLHQQPSSSTLFNSALGSPPIYHPPTPSSSSLLRMNDTITYQPHTTAPRIALTDPLADMRARNLSRPHGLGPNSDWPSSSTAVPQQQQQRQQTTTTTASGTSSVSYHTPISPDTTHKQQPISRPGLSRQSSDMSFSASELDHTYGDNDEQDPDDYAWSDEDDVEDSAKFEEEQAKELRMGGGTGRISLWKIIRFLATTFLGNLIISCILIVPVLVMQFYYRKHLPAYVPSDSPEANTRRNHQDFIADNVQAAFVWAAFNLHMMWWLHIGVELFPRMILSLVRGIWGSASQRLLGLAEFYASIKQFIKPVFYAAMSWGSWAIIYGTPLYDLYNNGNTSASRASYTPRLYQVVQFFFFFVLTICAEKILIKFIAMKFHTSAYAERLAQVAQALQVFDVLRDYRPRVAPQPSSRPGTPGLFTSNMGLPKGFGGPGGQSGTKSSSGRSTPMKMEPMTTDRPGTASSSADNSISKRRHADRRPPYFPVDGADEADLDDADDEKDGTTGSKTLVDRVQKKNKSKKTKAPPGGGGGALHNLFHPTARKETVEDPDTGIELDAQTGMPLRNRSHFDGTEGTTPAGSGFKSSTFNSHSTTSRNASPSNEPQHRRRRSRVRRRALATASQARAIARIAMNDPFGLLSSSQLLGGVGADITGPAEAKRLARTIFKRFRGTHRRRYLVEADFEPAFEGREASKRAFAVFDRDGNGDISQTEIKNTVLATYKERRFLARSVQDVHHAVSTLDKVILCVAALVLLFEALAIFKVNIQKMVTTVFTLGLAFAFIFKQTASNVFDSIVFLFVTHAFDTGDRIMLGKQIMVVKRMSLLSTQFTLADG